MSEWANELVQRSAQAKQVVQSGAEQAKEWAVWANEQTDVRVAQYLLYVWIINYSGPQRNENKGRRDVDDFYWFFAEEEVNVRQVKRLKYSFHKHSWMTFKYARRMLFLLQLQLSRDCNSMSSYVRR